MRRAEVLGPPAEAATVGAEAVEATADELGISCRQVYLLLQRWREGQGVVRSAPGSLQRWSRR